MINFWKMKVTKRASEYLEKLLWILMKFGYRRNVGFSFDEDPCIGESIVLLSNSKISGWIFIIFCVQLYIMLKKCLKFDEGPYVCSGRGMHSTYLKKL